MNYVCPVRPIDFLRHVTRQPPPTILPHHQHQHQHQHSPPSRDRYEDYRRARSHSRSPIYRYRPRDVTVTTAAGAMVRTMTIVEVGGGVRGVERGVPVLVSTATQGGGRRMGGGWRRR